MTQEQPIVSHSIRNRVPLSLPQFLYWLTWRPMRFRWAEITED